MLAALVPPLASATLALVGFVTYRFVYRPLDAKAEEAMRHADAAHDRVDAVEQDVNRQQQLLVGGGSDADRGVLVRLEQAIDRLENRLNSNEAELEALNRLLTENTYNVQEIRRRIGDLDDDFDGDFVRGEDATDGGIPMYHLDDTNDSE